MIDRRASADALPTAARIMDGFLLATGVVGEAPPRRYLWTDAFAVCTLLSLADAGLKPGLGGSDGYRALALRLVDQVHGVLGRHRDDDPRRGWISGLSDEDGAARPTAGGLRIGKPLPERGPDQGMDARLEWERDGQYFHYLTKWMHALRRVAASQDDPDYLTWAIDLAKAAQRGFAHGTAQGGRALYWKMSIDLSRPLVASSGQHDPLDGYLIFRTLVAPGAPLPPGAEGRLHEEIIQLASMARLSDWRRWITDDPLGLGGLLTDAHRIAQLEARGTPMPQGLLAGILDAALHGLRAYLTSDPFGRPPGARLAFRELGLSIGLHALARLSSLLQARGASGEIESRVDALRAGTRGMIPQIEDTWTRREAQGLATWRAHEDINAVMLATSLAPEGYLAL